MIETAEKFRGKPAIIYNCAEKGQEVIITHDRYSDVVFKLTAIDKAKWEQGVSDE